MFVTKLGQYPIILGILWFKKHAPHIRFDWNTVTFDSPFCLQNCCPVGQPITVNGVEFQFDYPPYYPIPPRQAVDLFSVDEFIPDPHARSSSYHHLCPRLLSPSAQVVRDSSASKSSNRRSRPRSRSLSMSSSTSLSLSLSTFSVSSSSSQTSIGADFPWTRSPQPSYFYSSSHRIDTKDNIRIMNQELSMPKDWVSPLVPVRLQKEPAGRPTMDILMIGATPFNLLM